MDIAALSIDMKDSFLKMQVALKVQNMVMDTASQDMDALRQMMEQSLTPGVGAHIDLKV